MHYSHERSIKQNQLRRVVTLKNVSGSTTFDIWLGTLRAQRHKPATHRRRSCEQRCRSTWPRWCHWWARRPAWQRSWGGGFCRTRSPQRLCDWTSLAPAVTSQEASMLPGGFLCSFRPRQRSPSSLHRLWPKPRRSAHNILTSVGTVKINQTWISFKTVSFFVRPIPFFKNSNYLAR